MHHNVSYAAAVYNGNNTDDVMTPYLLQAVTRLLQQNSISFLIRTSVYTCSVHAHKHAHPHFETLS